MDIEEFMEYIKEHILEVFEIKEGNGFSADDCEVMLGEVMRNNGIRLHGLSIRVNKERTSPNIILDSFYDAYQHGVPTSLIMEQIWSEYHRVKDMNISCSADITNLEEVKDNIIMRLVNYDRNKDRLASCPHTKFLDMVITYHYIAEMNAEGVSSALITDSEMALWGLTTEELHELAVSNTERLFPPHMESLSGVIAKAIKKKVPEECGMAEEIEMILQCLEETPDKINMWVLSNDQGRNGANCILYKNQLAKVAEELDANLYILPSSIHEVMLVVENEDTEPEYLQELVQDANMSAVGLIDLLSDNIYYYDRDKDEVSIYEQTAVT